MQDAFKSLKPIDQLTVRVVVDNETDGISSPCDACKPASSDADTPSCCSYVSEFSSVLMRDGGLDFDRVCTAGHGLSLLLTARVGDGTRTLLFDGGPTTDLWGQNAARLRLDLAAVEAGVLSHWHLDHSGGLPRAGREIVAAKRHQLESAPDTASRSPVLDVHSDRPRRRGIQLPSGKIVPFNEEPTIEELESAGWIVQHHTQPHTLLDGCFYISGKIPRKSRFEDGQPGHMRQQDDGTWEPDPLILDERYLTVHIRGKGLVVFSACSHAGVMNVVRDAAAASGVQGGMHLVSPPCEARIPATVAALQEAEPALVLAGHCTGWRAKAALAAGFPGRFMPLLTGGTYTFGAANDES